ncbi:DUF4362 domain-containing protein [Paenibacillus woosongensis]|uniref:DUF4362 domain-containing protein n=1 Tax=Paenibacillus woosongensis TaxID=307580 RepID=A0ABQ4MRD5_9BACL|nr:DUF4362 domain-containing protein [Paenibacillus woosongensis]GIP58499.1 hypothetical protein J15TS10_23130 [Paenibacillus woosongensis]
MRNINKFTFLLLLVILIMSVSMIWVVINSMDKGKDADKHEVSRNHSILINFDENDFEQLEDLVSRFKEGKGNYLMLIPPIVDGGYWIHDVYSNGREIKWTIDNTRDGMSGDGRGIRKYTCKAIDKNETEELFTIELSQCDDLDPNEKLSVISIWKE